MSTGPQLTVVTITTRNCFHRTRVLMQDVARHMPAAHRVVCCVDPAAGLPDIKREEFELVDATAAGVPRFRELAFALGPTALCCALKPYLLLHVFDRLGASQAVYLDNDLRIYRPPDELTAALATQDLVLTPHLLAPPPPGSQPNEGTILSYGTFNAGLIGASATRDTRAFLGWWGQLMATPRNLRIHPGFDQKWLEYAPSFLPRFAVLRHAGYNVASWNLSSRPLTVCPDGLHFGGEPLTIFHFSSFDEYQPERLIRSGLTCNYVPEPAVVTLAEDYGRALETAGAAACKNWGYGFAAFNDGRPISDVQRSYYIERIWDLAPAYADPFDPAFGIDGFRGARSLYRHHGEQPSFRRRWRRWIAVLAGHSPLDPSAL